MADSLITCAYCGEESLKRNGAINRAKKDGKPMFCNKACFGLSERNYKTKEQLTEDKRLYDIEYRKRPEHKAQKAASHLRIYDPVKAAIKRKERMPYHVEYCRQPAYRAKKKVYDRIHLAKKNYGELWELHLLTRDIQDEVNSRMEKQQIRVEAGTYNKTQRRHSHEQRINSEKLESRTLGDTR